MSSETCLVVSSLEVSFFAFLTLTLTTMPMRRRRIQENTPNFLTNNATYINASAVLDLPVPESPTSVDLSDVGNIIQSVTGDLLNTTAKYLCDTIFGWQYLGIGQTGNRIAAKFGPYNTTFVLDQNISLHAGIVPYNSSIW
jgi:hypothetical protein